MCIYIYIYVMIAEAAIGTSPLRVLVFDVCYFRPVFPESLPGFGVSPGEFRHVVIGIIITNDSRGGRRNKPAACHCL